jgi:citrate lyase subunit beta/citryl-CoA lyase
MRSLLFVPGDSERKLEKSLGAGPDIHNHNIED